MFIVAYLCLSGLVWLLGLALTDQARQHAGAYTALSLLTIIIGLVVFHQLSIWANLPQTGNALSKYYPDDYLARGTLGVLILLVPLFGLASPVLVAWLVGRMADPQETAE